MTGFGCIRAASALLLVLAFALASANPAVPVGPHNAAGGEGFYELIGKRLELMTAVAAHKWRHRQPIEDLQREALVIDQAVADALRYGFTVGSSRAFFAAQIEAAKEIQRHWFEVWQSAPGPPSAPDLEREVRPELLRLGSEILAAAARRGREFVSPQMPAALDVAGLSEPTKGALLAVARGLERYPHRLRQILDSGVLRVGTTGDYAPFSHRGDGDAEFEGIDIDLARDLAEALGVTVKFVPTSWPTLLDDLLGGEYDIGMSGISRTLGRQQHGYLSQPYFVGGKTPIARCDRAAGFASLAAIDRAGVRVVVNPGGTNEQFVDANIRRADKVMHQDNRTIFRLLIAGEADVMITDRVEVGLQTALHPQLCATMSGNLNYQEKAYLLPQDEVWRSFVDTWLALAVGSGTVAAVFRQHQVPPNIP